MRPMDVCGSGSSILLGTQPLDSEMRSAWQTVLSPDENPGVIEPAILHEVEPLCLCGFT